MYDELVIAPGDVVADRYRVLSVIATGTRSVVLWAEQRLGQAERQVVLQLFLDASHETQRAANDLAGARMRERSMAPWLAPIDFGMTTSGRVFLVFAYVDGFDPRHLFSPPLSPAPGDFVQERYRIERVVEVDDLAVTYEGVHEGLGQSVQLYVLRSELAGSESHHRQIVDLALTSARDPDNPRRVVDVGTLDDGRPFMVLVPPRQS
ncbi:MAG: hypothetical protein U0183_07770 [Polyangiaceae bacterium]